MSSKSVKRLVHEAKSLVGKNYGKGGLTTDKLLGNLASIAVFMASQGLQHVNHMKTKHVTKFFEFLKQKGLDDDTMANYATAIRKVARNIGKPNIVPKLNIELGIDRSDRYKPQKRNDENALLVRQKLYIDATWKGLAWDLQDVYGLRRKESVLSVKTIYKEGMQCLVVKGAKGSRPRDLPIDSDKKADVIAKVQDFIERNGWDSLIPPHLNLKQGLKALSNTASRSGGTKKNHANMHANRGNCAQEMHSRGVPRQKIAGHLGHGRKGSTKSYC
jgi:hypothetical protein